MELWILAPIIEGGKMMPIRIQKPSNSSLVIFTQELYLTEHQSESPRSNLMNRRLARKDQRKLQMPHGVPPTVFGKAPSTSSGFLQEAHYPLL